MGINSGIGLNYSLGVDAIDGNNNKFHINRIDDADGFKQNLLTIKSDGNVGIGVSSPETPLDEVLEDSNHRIQFYKVASAFGDHSPQFGIKFRWGNRDNTILIGATHGGDYNSSGLQFRTMDKQNIVDAMHIRPNGNVGIGVSSPDHKLTLLSSTQYG